MKNTEDKVTLYIGTHNDTNLKYFGKTTEYFTVKDLQKYYHGSGKYWKDHLKVHGDDVTMEIYGIFDIDEVKEIALKFSKDNNIVEDYNNWANQKPENGLDGGYNNAAVMANTGMSTYQDKEGNKFRLKIDDPRISKDKLFHPNKSTRPSLSNNLAVSKANKRKAIYKDKDGNRLKLEITDARVLSGEYVGMHSGTKYEENDTRYETRRGGKPHNAQHIKIFNSLNMEMYDCLGNFKAICETNKLPYGALRRSANEGIRVYESEHSFKRVQENNKQYKKWYAIIVK